MSKVLKYLLLGLAALTVLLVAVVAYIAATFDPNDYKPRLIELVQQKTQRTLAIPGDIRLTFFPRVGADLGQISLSERRSDQRFASAGQVQVSVALLPLLSRQVVVDRVRVDGLDVRLRHGKNGQSNYDDLVPRGRDDAPPSPPAAPADADAAAEALRLDIGGIAITNTRLSYSDERSGQKLTVSGLQLQTGPIAQGRTSRLDFAARIEGEQPRLALQLKVEAGFTPDLARRVVMLESLLATLGGSAADISDLQLKLSALTLELSPTRVHTDTLALEANVTRGTQRISAKLGTGLTGDLAALRFELDKLRAELQLPNPAGGTLALQAQGKLMADLGRESVQTTLTGQLDSTRLEIQAGLKSFARPAIDFDIAVGDLDADRYLPKREAPAAAAVAAPAGGAAEQPIDLSALQSLDATGTLKVAVLKIANLKVGDIRLALKLARGKAEISPLTATLYGGRLDGALSASAGKPQRLAARLNLQAIHIGPLLKDALDQQPVDGRGNVTLDLGTSGATLSQFKKGLNGTASLALKEGALNGINIAAALRDAKARLGGGAQQGKAEGQEKTDFTELGASFRITNGVARNDDLAAKTPLLRLGGSGDIFIAEDRLDYTVRATVVPTLQGEGGPELEQLKGLTIPVRLSGPYTAIGWKIDFGSLAGNRAKELLEQRQTQIREEAQKKLDEEKARLEQRLKEQAGDRLKNLLGR